MIIDRPLSLAPAPVFAEVDRAIDLATTAATDDERRKYYSAVQKLVAEDAPYISLWYKTNLAVARPNITGVRLSP